MAGPFKMKGSPMQRNFGIGSPAKKTYKQAYKDAQEKNWTKENETEEAYIKRAKAENTKKYGTTEPTKEAAKAGQTKAELAEAHKKTTTKNVKTVKRDGEDVVVKKGVEANKGKTLTAQEKSKERLKIDQANKSIKDAKKSGDKNARDKAQLEKGEIKSGRDNKKTGTVVSRWFAKRKVKRNKKQLAKRNKKEE